MKSFYLLLFLFPVIVTGCKSSKPVATKGQSQDTPSMVKSESHTVENGVSAVPAGEVPAVNYADQATWVLGFFNLRQLRNDPHGKWYLEGYDNYMPETEALNSLINTSFEDLSIKIVLGTWCPDSRKQVPRFMRIIDIWKFPESSITFIGVDNQKLSPIGDFEKLDIQRVPTFIIYKKNIEIGRIIENPVTSLEQDMVKILTGNK